MSAEPCEGEVEMRSAGLADVRDPASRPTAW